MKDEVKRLGIVILAAGKGTRMKSDRAKVLHKVAGRPMLDYVLQAAFSLDPERVAIVIGHQGEEVRNFFQPLYPSVRWVWQKEMRGTGDAVRHAWGSFSDFVGSILVLYGDIPGIRVETLRRLAMVHESSQNAITLLTTELEDPQGYGRIVLASDHSVAKIVEEKDASELEKEILEINSGIGMYNADFLFESVQKLTPLNQQKEYYLTDLVAMARMKGLEVGRLRIRDDDEVMGINDQEQLAQVAQNFYERRSQEAMRDGVVLVDPISTILEPSVIWENEVRIGENTSIRGVSHLGAQSRIGSSVDLNEVRLGANVVIGNGCAVEKADIGVGTVMGKRVILGKGES